MKKCGFLINPILQTRNNYFWNIVHPLISKAHHLIPFLFIIGQVQATQKTIWWNLMRSENIAKGEQLKFIKGWNVMI